MDSDHKHQRPEVTYAGTGIDKRYRDWLVHVNGVLHRKASTAAQLHRDGRYAELADFIQDNPN